VAYPGTAQIFWVDSTPIISETGKATNLTFCKHQIESDEKPIKNFGEKWHEHSHGLPKIFRAGRIARSSLR